jgi:hypothetical protein
VLDTREGPAVEKKKKGNTRNEVRKEAMLRNVFCDENSTRI